MVEQLHDELSATIAELRAYLGWVAEAGPRFVALPPQALIPMPDRPRPDRQTAASLPIVSLEDVRARMGECTLCKLHNGRHTIVFGVGNPNARLMFVGEAPGE